MAQRQRQFLDNGGLGVSAVGGVHQDLVNVSGDPDTVESLGASFLEPADAGSWDLHVSDITSLPPDHQLSLW